MFYAVTASVAFAVVYYWKRSDENESFSKPGLLATAIVGLGIGLISFATGQKFTAESLEVQLFLYAGLIAMLEGLLKGIWRRVLGQGKRVSKLESKAAV